jgi:hypothetical protein
VAVDDVLNALKKDVLRKELDGARGQIQRLRAEVSRLENLLSEATRANICSTEVKKDPYFKVGGASNE